MLKLKKVTEKEPIKYCGETRERTPQTTTIFHRCHCRSRRFYEPSLAAVAGQHAPRIAHSKAWRHTTIFHWTNIHARSLLFSSVHSSSLFPFFFFIFSPPWNPTRQFMSVQAFIKSLHTAQCHRQWAPLMGPGGGVSSHFARIWSFFANFRRRFHGIFT